MAISRGNSLLMKKQWAEDGSTVIPNPPVAGTTYRDESVDAENIAEGQQYDGVADSARWNQLLYIMTGILKDTLEHGVLPWLNTQDYAEGAVVMGSNGTLYIAKKANGPTTTNAKDPTTDTTADTWKTVLAISSAKAPLDITDGALQISVGEGIRIESDKLELKPYKGATASESGELGGVPPATKEDKDKFLKGDGSWAVAPWLPLTGGTLTGDIYSSPAGERNIGSNEQFFRDLYVKAIRMYNNKGVRVANLYSDADTNSCAFLPDPDVGSDYNVVLGTSGRRLTNIETKRIASENVYASLTNSFVLAQGTGNIGYRLPDGGTWTVLGIQGTSTSDIGNHSVFYDSVAGGTTVQGDGSRGRWFLFAFRRSI